MTEATTRETVLVVEDDPAIRTGLQMNLRSEGYTVIVASDSPTGLSLCREHEPDLVLLDLMLPGGSGLDLLAVLRREGREMPVLILTALGQEEDVVRGLGRGADDYIAKPFSLPELLALVAAALRRRRAEVVRRRQAVKQVGALEVVEDTGEVRRDGETVKVTARELELLRFLMRHPDRIYSRAQLLEQVWGPDYEGTARTVDNFICSLRVKIERDPARPRHLITVRGLGYRLKP